MDLETLEGAASPENAARGHLLGRPKPAGTLHGRPAGATPQPGPHRPASIPPWPRPHPGRRTPAGTLGPAAWARRGHLTVLIPPAALRGLRGRSKGPEGPGGEGEVAAPGSGRRRRGPRRRRRRGRGTGGQTHRRPPPQPLPARSRGREPGANQMLSLGGGVRRPSGNAELQLPSLRRTLLTAPSLYGLARESKGIGCLWLRWPPWRRRCRGTSRRDGDI